MNDNGSKFLFIINPSSGNNSIDYAEEIKKFFSSLPHKIRLYELPANCSPEKIKQKIEDFKPDKVVAVGGDGTVKLTAECLLETGIPLGIIPGGSANGMAKEFGIAASLENALEIVVTGKIKKIHLVKINGELCIHLGDIGFNAFVVKKFETQEKRGIWGYVKAAFKVLISHDRMQVSIETDHENLKREAAMVVVANATKYGTGILINPEGTLEDNLFEVVIIRKISIGEIFKMMITHTPFNPTKTELLQTRSLNIHSRRKVHFQVDGEYLGKVNEITATILPASLPVIVPRE